MTHRRSRAWSTSCSSTTSQSSIASIYARINRSTSLAEPEEGHTNVHGSFTTTIPATLWLRDCLSLHIPRLGKRPARQRSLDCGYDTPPDSPLSLFQSFPPSRRSPSISRTLLTDSDFAGSFVGSTTSSPPTFVSSPVTDNNNDVVKLPSVLKAIERNSKLSRSTMCSTCMKAGTNFPRCARCDETWCSRACRLQGGKKHVCAPPKT